MGPITASPAVLDACVLVPAALRDTLLTTAAIGLYQPYWSETILDEVGRALLPLTGSDRAARLVTTLRREFPRALVSDFEALIESMPTPDLDDRHVLAVAVRSGARVIVTSNVRDFPNDALRPLNVEAWLPDTFLCVLLDAHSALILDIITRQAARLTRPVMSVVDVLDHVSVHAPRFAARVRAAHERGQV